MVTPVTRRPQTGRPEAVAQLPTLDLVEVGPTVPLHLRRLGAWCAEAGLVMLSGLVPLGLGWAATQTSMATVPLNPLLSATQQRVANTLQIPKHRLKSAVPPVTNLLWTVGLLAPLGVGYWQGKRLVCTGQTPPKAWLKLKIVDAQGCPPHWRVMLVRESLRWGLPLALTYGVAAASGASLGLGLLAIAGAGYLGLGLTSFGRRDRTAWHDQIAGTQVIGIGIGDARPTYQVTPADIFEPSPRRLLPPPSLYGAATDDGLMYRTNGHRTNGHQHLRNTGAEGMATVSHADGGLSSIVLSPLGPTATPLPPRSRRFPLRSLSLVGLGGLVVGSVWGTQTYIQAQVDQQLGDWSSDRQFLTAVQTLITTPENTTEYQAAILALARISDPRAVDYLADLLTQTDDPEILDTLQQALASQGLTALPALRQLSLTLASDLTLAATDEVGTLHRQQQATQAAITKILYLQDGQLAGARFDKVDLSYRAAAPAPFRLRVTDIDAAGTHWRGARLAQATLSGNRFAQAGADQQWDTVDDIVSDFSGADLKEADLSGTDLRSALLVRTSLLRARLSHSNLTGADLSHSNLSSAELRSTEATGSRWIESQLVGADLTGANFQQANLTRAQLSQVDATDSQWSQATLQDTQWREANLTGADLSQANLTRAALTGSRLQGANLSNANLSDASLRDADLVGVTLSGANLNGTDLAGARFTEGAAIAANSFITATPDVDPGTPLQGVDFSRAKNLDNQQLNDICAQGGLHPACRRLGF